MQHDPAAMFAHAKMKQLRRNQLWHAAKMACPSYETFRTSLTAIEAAISAQLAAEFPT